MTQGAGRPFSSDAPAKLNLYLHVTARRADGYHELDSLIAFAAPFDHVSAAPADELSLLVCGPFAPELNAAGGKNLVETAARRLAELARIEPAARITLDKRLPVAAGIGGGSSDAAAALRALISLWRLTPDPQALQALALSLGADVPMCLHGRTCFAGGIGEALDPAPALPDCALLLVNPGLALATPDVFAARKGAFSAPARFAEAPADCAALAEILAARRNDLEAPALALAPVIGDVLEALRGLPGCRLARMSGSGATCFALFDGAAEADEAGQILRPRQRDWWIAPSRLVHTKKR
ncbi:MAG: 4-(cytidine 5'-diphospho)-2-C-methyl-D-erythritol kinase [Alphaproteobacteria bacterium]|nr:4-(cytidine 5'-diphospho)-2-C-methyl-D-erythritol kinase [Alphaproteobacteria bacterium]MDP6590166.1 4-(cytidine 5'-diphospho)-2-C-methyl-D-erythritol kinase [Alphaproteobacteria bacterium]MDP6817504.1 4-(cytidine 5'-diphospho)-2-C-methyl-D-erythritol kinase [Alphaproteobacteria bacterium]